MCEVSVCVYIEDSVDQSSAGPCLPQTATTTTATTTTAVLRSSAVLPPVDNLVIDNMDDLPPLVFDTATAHDVAQLSRILIHFLLTR